MALSNIEVKTIGHHVWDENGFPILKFNSHFPDFDKLSVDGIKYMNNIVMLSRKRLDNMNNKRSIFS